MLYLIMGLIFVGAGVFSYAMITGILGSSGIPAGMGDFMRIMPVIFGGSFGLVGVILSLVGVRQILNRGKRTQLAKQLAENGIETEGVISFVDRNYSLLINNRPIYSIVEYRYKDGMGTEHVNRLSDINTELVIRAGWQVGSNIKVRYLEGDPSKSGIVG